MSDTLDRFAQFIGPPSGPAPSTEPSFPGRMIGKYRLVRKVGQGGMGVVYEAEDTQLKRRVAIKVLADPGGEAELIQRLYREASIAARLKHPNIVTVHELGLVRDETGAAVHFIAMDFIEGRTLSQMMAGRAERRELLRLLEETARAVGYAHDNGVVHRDVKPQNVLVDEAGRAYLSDFGLARGSAFASKLTKSNEVLGTPQYMAPEQVLGQTRQIGPRTDVYALGVILYEMLAGRPPFAGDTPIALYQQIVTDDAKPPGVDAELEAICLKSLDKEAARRYANGTEFAEDVARWLRGEPVSAKPPSLRRRAWRALRRRARPLIIALAVAASVWPVMAVVRRAREDRRQLEAGTKAARLLESARPAFYDAQHYLYNPRASYDELVRRIDAAVPMVEEACVLAPRDPLGPYLLGWAWEIKGWPDRAEREWRRALALDPHFGPAHYRLGGLLLQRAFEVQWWFVKNDRDVRAAAAARLADEARRAFEESVRLRSGFDNELQQRVAELMVAYLAPGADYAAVRAMAVDAARAFESRDGEEEFHWLVGILSQSLDSIDPFTRAIERRPKFPMALISRAMEYRRTGRPAEAADDLTAALSIRPRFTSAWLTRGSVRLDQGDVAGAVADFDEVIRLDPGFAPGYVNRGRARTDAPFEQRLADFDTAIRLDPTLPHSFQNRGLLWLKHGDRARAIQDFDRAVELDPDEAEYWYTRAHATFDTDATATERALAKAIDLNPQYWAALAERGRLRHIRGDWRDAIADCDRAIAINPASAEAHAIRGKAWRELQDVAQAGRDFARALEIDPSLWRVWTERAAMRGQGGDVDGAVADCDQALRLNPECVHALVIRGAMRRKRRDWIAARADFDAAIRLDSRYMAAYLERGMVRDLAGDVAGSIEDFTQSIALEPSADAYAQRGDSLRKTGDVKGALADLEEAIRRKPDYAWAFAVRGEVRMGLSEWAAAEADFTTAIRLKLAVASTFYHRGRCRYALDQLDGAMSDFDAILAVKPGSPEVRYARAKVWKARGDYRRAAEDAAKALEFAPADWPERAEVEAALRSYREKITGP